MHYDAAQDFKRCGKKKTKAQLEWALTHDTIEAYQLMNEPDNHKEVQRNSKEQRSGRIMW